MPGAKFVQQAYESKTKNEKNVQQLRMELQKIEQQFENILKALIGLLIKG